MLYRTLAKLSRGIVENIREDKSTKNRLYRILIGLLKTLCAMPSCVLGLVGLMRALYLCVLRPLGAAHKKMLTIF